ncbi:MAG: hypothetical protein GW772_09715 [Flavobacteriia bacterium]|nr:hypothetical protein [Flavobacteriia bacterium]OIP47133.1 MAG: hypothetical protein AUK46_06415 [Flavobacteriaceae bacterium CG2_30_31_66]PIV96407.1 MAG: hypothetical protein COW43_08285 [Flavobacteriaceae bacterium CG17_big_fil_post_rev_8_21_14_2_50_31_13]PIX12636.1 MAG: hypothetical protein COZ74_10490 [Flavobacteriaceae bacterium CG_4_8_14_3_um_filter_31_8]PIY16372.1 MAG: hypothetical protein COZ16_00030 [Flavobacteriaceae bacterium CG_4_10_14_3_um_filter_31_253]PIZ11377.1 MAG: hypotheti
MASTSETGHNKNVANFSSAFQILQEMGTLYNPSNAKIQLATLDPIRASLQTTINELNTKKPIYKNAVAEREEAIAPLNKMVTRVLNYAKSIDISITDKENISSQAKKIRGVQKQKTLNPETTEASGISTSQMSYDSRIANLDAFTKQLASYPEYNPNETALKIETLQAQHTNLVNLSTTVNTAGNALITARINRNYMLYKSENNIIQLMRDIKSYLKSLGNEAKPYYSAIQKLKFVEKL